MRNIIDLDLTINNGEFDILHNGMHICKISDSGVSRIEVSNFNENNDLVLKFSGESASLNSITMFEMGAGKLIYFGVYKEPSGKEYMCQDFENGGSWTISYEFPVFSWLHRVLHLGWLIDQHTL